MARVLVIEDASLIRREILTVLRLEGFDAIGAASGRAGLQLARRYQPDLILCDVMMPDLDGYGTLDALRNDPETEAIPFIFLTAMDGRADVRQGMKLGADDYLIKPVMDTDLLDAVRARLARQQTIASRAAAARAEAEQARRETEAQLEQLQRAISVNVSQELRASVAGLMQMLDLVLKERFGANPQTRREYVQQALANTRRIHSLIEDLIALQEIDQGTINTFRQTLDRHFDFEKPVEEAAERWQAKGLDLHVRIAPNVMIYAPKIGFRHAVAHLVDNACKFSPEEGRVDVELFANGEGGCLLLVRDAGPGIPPELRERLFDRFFQAPQPDGRTAEGLGVGLTIARAFARALGGDVRLLDSDQGCLVEMFLPHAPADWEIGGAGEG